MTPQENIRLAKTLLSHKQSFERFYHEYAPKLRGYLRVKIESEDDAEEVLQDTFFSFLEALRDFRGQSQVATYLISICRNKTIDYYRKKKIKSVVFSHVPQLESLVSTILAPEEVYDKHILQEKIKRTMKKILPLYRDLLLCKYDEEMSVEAIASRFRLSFKSAEAKLFRARKAFVLAFSKQ